MPSTPGTLNYPTSPDDAISLIQVANNASSALGSAIDNVQLTIPVATPGLYPTTGVATIVDALNNPTKREVVIYTSIVGSNLIVPVGGRGQQGTTAQAFTAGFVQGRPTARHHTVLADAVISLQTKLNFTALAPAQDKRLLYNNNGAIGAAAGTAYSATANPHLDFVQQVSPNLVMQIREATTSATVDTIEGVPGLLNIKTKNDLTMWGLMYVNEASSDKWANFLTNSGTLIFEPQSGGAIYMLSHGRLLVSSDGVSPTPQINAQGRNTWFAQIQTINDDTWALGIGHDTAAINTSSIFWDDTTKVGINQLPPSGSQFSVTSGDVARIGMVVNSAPSPTADIFQAQRNASAVLQITSTGAFKHATVARTSGSAAYFQTFTPADTTLTASVESIGAQIGGNASAVTVTRQFAAGALTTQREYVFVAPTYAFASASTITTAATVAITGAPVAGTNAAITNACALWVQGGIGRFDGKGQFFISNNTPIIGNVSNTFGGVDGGGARRVSVETLVNGGIFHAYTDGTANFFVGINSINNGIVGTLNARILEIAANSVTGAILDLGQRFGVGNTSAPLTGQLDVLSLSASRVAVLVNSAANSSVDLAQFNLNADDTATVANLATFGVNSNGTAATGFGGSFTFNLESSTTNDQNAALLGWLWTDATHASKTGALIFQTVTNAAALAEVLRVGGATDLKFTGIVRTSGSPTHVQFVTPADTTLAASVESIFAQYGGNASAATVTRQFATGALTTQRENVFVAPTYSFVGASTITNAVTLDITGGPVAGANATITNAYALRATGVSKFDYATANTTTAPSLIIDSPVGGSTFSAMDFYVGGASKNRIDVDGSGNMTIGRNGFGYVQVANSSQANLRINNSGNTILWVGACASGTPGTALIHGVGFGAATVGFIISSVANSTVDLAQFNLNADDTNTVANLATFAVNSNGTAAAGFGQSFTFTLESSTTDNQNAASTSVLWTTATHASRTAAYTISTVTSAGSLTEIARFGGGSSRALTLNLGTTNQQIALGYQTSGNDFPGIWFGTNATTPSLSNYSFLYEVALNATILNASNGINLRVSNLDWLVLDGPNTKTYVTASTYFLVGTTTLSGTDTHVRLSQGTTTRRTLLVDGPTNQSVDLANFTLSTNATNAVANLVTFTANSGGTAATGLGGSFTFNLESSTTNDQNAAAMIWKWIDATHASRTADIIFQCVHNAAALATAFTIRSNGYYLWNGQKRVSTQFDKTSSTALADITGLSVNVAAGRTYYFEAVLYTSSNSAGGVKFAVAGTATATAITYEASVYNAAAFSAQTRATALATTVGAVTAVTAALCYITGTITVNAAGTLTVQFAQNASSGTASSVLVGSIFIVNEIA